jgi:hypothetical protein
LPVAPRAVMTRASTWILSTPLVKSVIRSSSKLGTSCEDEVICSRATGHRVAAAGAVQPVVARAAVQLSR